MCKLTIADKLLKDSSFKKEGSDLNSPGNAQA